jgi:hypothetical protein
MRFFSSLFLLLLCAGALGLRAADAGKTDYAPLGFDQLASFPFTPPDMDTVDPKANPPSCANQIPARIKALDEQRVAVTGYMLPTKMEGGLVKEFLLVKDPMLCCYGIMPKVNEWVVVRMVGTGVKALMDVPLTFDGKLRVGEMYENGYLSGIYLLEGDKQAETKG